MSQPATMTITEFKARCLRLVEELPAAGLVLTKRGHPVARVLPSSPSGSRDLIGALKGRITVRGDIVSTGVRWRAQS